MFNILKFLRCLVFFLFVICNTIIIPFAVQNLSIVRSNPVFDLGAAKAVDGYLIFVGASGLLLVFPVIFLELYGANTFAGRVWFELLWVGFFLVLELAGAAAITAQSSSNACAGNQGSISIQVVGASVPCSTAVVLQAFTWICTFTLLGYFTLLAVLSVLKRKDDPTIWHCNVRSFPLKSLNALRSNPTTPTEPGFRTKSPVIAAPKPRRAANTVDPVLSYRSGLDPEYDIEHFQPPPFQPPPHMSLFNTIDRPIPPIPVPTTSQVPQIRQTTEQAQMHQPLFSTPFYHSSVQVAFEKQTDSQPQAPPLAQMAQIRRLPPSPPPLGDWPRLDATSRPPRTKRKPLPQPRESLEQTEISQPQPTQSTAPLRSLPQPRSMGPTSSSSYVVEVDPSLSTSPSRSRPTGPRRKSSEDNRPPALDLSNISSYRSNAFR